MPNRLSFGIKHFCKIPTAVFLVLTLFVTPAHAKFELAGFEWVTPAAPAPPPMGAPVLSAPMPPPPGMAAPSSSSFPFATESPEVISPVVVEGQPPSAGSPNEMSPNAATGETVVHGFANNVPLAVALRQVLPPGYGFSIDQNVDMGTPVSFKGGKSWTETLQDMLQSAGLTMHQENQTIYIGRPAQVLTPPPSAMATHMPASPAPAEPSVVVMEQPLPASPIGTAQGMLDKRTGAVVPMSSTYDLETQQNQNAARMPTLSTAAVDTWTAPHGDTLHKVLQDWCRRANAELDWLAEYDYPLQASITFTGTFEEAVRALLSGFEEAHPQPIAELHNNTNAGQRVLVIQTRGNNYND